MLHCNRHGLFSPTSIDAKGFAVLIKVLTQLRFDSVRIGDRGAYAPASLDFRLRDSGVIRMGFARLAEDSIRSWRGKKSGESLSAPDKILSAAIGTTSLLR